MSGMKVSQAEKAARGHWSRILPALGRKSTEKIGTSPARSVPGKTAFDLMTWKGGERGSVTSAGQVMAWR
ncbi:Uncharacterised protein [Citrobacter koseri]|uniref:Uncharacterized protein n=1 Tax=Citrobacter koseri TaxID=545 RepID=A0A447URZ5_CITKO|nr:Uncharacterised protein [Citrobacter koseri]